MGLENSRFWKSNCTRRSNNGNDILPAPMDPIPFWPLIRSGNIGSWRSDAFMELVMAAGCGYLY